MLTDEESQASCEIGSSRTRGEGRPFSKNGGENLFSDLLERANHWGGDDYSSKIVSAGGGEG